MKQKIVLIIGISLSLAFGVEAENDKKDTTMDRIETCKQNYTRLFGGEALTGKGSDPELMDILQNSFSVKYSKPVLSTTKPAR